MSPLANDDSNLRLRDGEREGDGLPVTHGSLLDFPADPVTCLRRLHAAHGPIAALQDGGQRIFFVFGPKWTQRVLSDARTFHSRFFAVRGNRNSAHRRLTSGLLSMNGDEHKQHRRMVMGPFQKLSIRNYHGPICQQVGELLDSWQVGDVRDVHEDMTHYMLRVTSALLFGLDEPEMAYHLGGMLDEWVQMNHEMGMGAFVADRRFTDGYDRLLKLAERLEVEIRGMIDLKRSRGAAGTDVLSLLIRAHEGEGLVSDETLVGHTALLFGAAHKTTAHTLCWTLFLLGQYPEVMREVWDEISAQVAGPSPTLDELDRLEVIERVLKESMRILPASGYSQRIAAEPVELGPFTLRRGEPVVFSQFITHRLPETFADPHRFQPERWRTAAPSPYAYLPFGNGPRMCIGATLAMMTLKLTLPSILKRYRLSAIAGSEVNGAIRSTMLTPLGTLPMRLHEPDGRFDRHAVRGNIHRLLELPPAAQSTRRRAA